MSQLTSIFILWRIMQIPIREIDFDNDHERKVHDVIVTRQKRLIELGDAMNQVSKQRKVLIPLERQFARLKQEQQSDINDLYGMTNEEVLLLSKLKEQYAAD